MHSTASYMVAAALALVGAILFSCAVAFTSDAVEQWPTRRDAYEAHVAACNRR